MCVCVCTRRFYFGYCEAGFDGRYIHDYHLTWVKDNGNSTVFTTSVSNGLSNGPATTATTAVTTTSTPGQQFASAALTAMQRELPSDPVNQVLRDTHTHTNTSARRHTYANMQRELPSDPVNQV